MDFPISLIAASARLSLSPCSNVVFTSTLLDDGVTATVSTIESKVLFIKDLRSACDIAMTRATGLSVGVGVGCGHSLG